MDALHALERLGGGHFMEELHFALLKVGGEVITSGKKGGITIKLTINPVKGEPLFVVQEEIAVSLPKSDARGALFYQIEGELHEKDVRQQEFQLRPVEDDAPKAREVKQA